MVCRLNIYKNYYLFFYKCIYHKSMIHHYPFLYVKVVYSFVANEVLSMETMIVQTIINVEVEV